jgi:PilZ domain
MNSHPQFIGLIGQNSMAETVQQTYPDKRKSRRAKIAKPLRVRPSEPREEHFEDLSISVNASKEGIYFHTRRSNYYKGMRVFVTFPFSSKYDPMNCEYVGEVVRVENLPNGRFGVALHLSMTLNYGSSAPPGTTTRA